MKPGRSLNVLSLLMVCALGSIDRAPAQETPGNKILDLPEPPSPEKKAEEAPAEVAPVKVVVEPSTLIWWNREIATFRSSTIEQTPQARSADALERIDKVADILRESSITTEATLIEEEKAVRFLVNETYLFSLLESDLDALSGQTLDEATKSALANLEEVRLARIEQGSAEAIAKGLTKAAVSTAIFVAAMILLRLITRRFGNAVERRIRAWRKLRVTGTDLRPHVGLIAKQLIKVLSFLFAFYLFCIWIAYAFNQFPLTEPLGVAFTGHLKDFGKGLLLTMLGAIPGIITAVIILMFTRWLARLVERIISSMGDDNSTGVMASDTAKATRRISVVVIWILGIVLAYPYLPGSGSEAFKGISVLLGLMFSLGSSGMINQVMSGFVLLYSGSVRTGEYIKLGKIEGTITEMGILAVKVLTPTNEFLTIPNAVMITNPTTNYTRLSKENGVPISSVVTIGYDAPWRIVHEILLAAAKDTKGIIESPEPRVLQKALSDWYAEYTLTGYAAEPTGRNGILSELNGRIQDGFNDAGIQIMSPHYRDDPSEPMVIPKDRWFTRPGSSAGPEVFPNS